MTQSTPQVTHCRSPIRSNNGRGYSTHGKEVARQLLGERRGVEERLERAVAEAAELRQQVAALGEAREVEATQLAASGERAARAEEKAAALERAAREA